MITKMVPSIGRSSPVIWKLLSLCTGNDHIDPLTPAIAADEPRVPLRDGHFCISLRPGEKPEVFGSM